MTDMGQPGHCHGGDDVTVGSSLSLTEVLASVRILRQTSREKKEKEKENTGWC